MLTTPTQKLGVRECKKHGWFWNLSASLANLYNVEYAVDLGHGGLSYIKLVYCHISLHLYIHSDIDFGRICSELWDNLKNEDTLIYVCALE